MDTDNPNNWRIEDRFSDSEISSISPLSLRLLTMYARTKKSIIYPTPMNVFAVVLMVEGLEYHYENFKRIVSGVTFPPSGIRNDADTISIKQAKLEAIAYINTVGQLYYWARKYQANTPTIDLITESFRHKYTAHLSIHKEEESDSETERALHLFAFTGGSLWNKDGNLILQIQRKQGKSITFDLVTQHSIVLEEIQSAFEKFIRTTQ